ncbi:MAG: lysophospholipid acyltransferase family protein [Candidatus Omnitrophica bacterium]|nr:lysophospholipid acyltransferase family protein [Candidatus Omnitrophota bacterium]
MKHRFKSGWGYQILLAINANFVIIFLLILMDRKKFFTRIKRGIGYIALLLSSLTCRLLPLKLIYFLGNNFSILGYRLARKQRRIALESLGIAFGREKSNGQIKRIALDCFRFMGKSGLELMYLMEKPALLKKRVDLEGREYLDKALAKGKGVILVTAHFGNFPLMLCRLSLEGYKVSGVMRFMRDAQAEKLFYKKRSQMGIKTIYSKPQKECTEKCLKTLRNNELLFLLIDQHFGSGGGVFVDFFGTKAATAPGPVVLALRTKAAILPCFIIRQKDDTHKIIFEPEMSLEQAEDYAQTLQVNIQRLTNIIEAYIRKYPAEWGWIHRRWKINQVQ